MTVSQNLLECSCFVCTHRTAFNRETKITCTEGTHAAQTLTLGFTARVTVKVHKQADPETVRTGKQKQDEYVADHSSTAKVTLWEVHVGILHERPLHRLENFSVWEWGGTKYLSMGSESKIVPIDDIEDVMTAAADDEIVLHEAQIVAISQLDSFKVYLHCKARVEML